MKIRYLSLLRFLFILISNPAFAKTTLSIPDAFNVLSVNGFNYSKPLLAKESLLNLQAGENKIAIEYEVIFKSANKNDFEIIKSKVFIIKSYLQANKGYQLQYLKQLNSKAAKIYIHNPIVKLVGDDGKKTKHTQFFPSLSSTGFINKNTKRNFKQNESILLISKNKKMSVNERQLRYWWNKASKEEKKSFLEKINNASMKVQ